MIPKPASVPNMTQDQWDELVALTDKVCDVLEGEQPMFALAALGNAACSIWDCYGDQIPRYVLDQWLDQIKHQADTMHRKAKH